MAPLLTTLLLALLLPGHAAAASAGDGTAPHQAAQQEDPERVYIDATAAVDVYHCLPQRDADKNDRLDNLELKQRTSEECVLELVRGMLRFNPLRRDKPMQSKDLFLNCLNNNGFKTPTEEELDDLKNEDLTEMNEIKKK